MTRSFEIDGGHLAYDDTGGDGPLVVCLPGMGTTRGTYRHLTPLLAEAGLRVVTADPRGHGDSDPGRPDHSPESTAADLLALLRHLGGGPATLVTSSYTGASAIWAAAEDPAAFAGLALLGPFARATPPPSPGMRLVLALLGRSRWAWMAYWSTLFKARKPGDHAAFKAQVSRALGRPGRMAVLRAQLAADKGVCAARSPEVRTPAVVVMGSADPDFPDPAAEARLVADALRGEVRLVEGAGHYPQEEFPAETAQAVLALVRTGA